MSGQARFIISLDCEGKWGMADKLEPYHDALLTDDALERVYEDLIGMLGRYQLPATFAFVMAFVLRPHERERFAAQLLGDLDDKWLATYREAAATGRLSGWHQPAALDMAVSARMHEIACHGFCHRPLDDLAISRAGADTELTTALQVAHLKGISPETFVFPRNRPGHLDALGSHGFIGYRQRLRRPTGKVGRAISLAEEFNMWAAPQRPVAGANLPIAIPPGRFLNWRFGMRARVPASVTLARWRHQLHHAVGTDNVVHLWLHPHNLITGPGTAELLESILMQVAKMRDHDKLRVLTQRDYCREQLGRNSAAPSRSFPTSNGLA